MKLIFNNKRFHYDDAVDFTLVCHLSAEVNTSNVDTFVRYNRNLRSRDYER